MKKLLLAVLLSVALISQHSQNPKLNNSEANAATTSSAGQVRQKATAPETKVEQIKTPAPQTPVPQPVAQGCESYRAIVSQYNWDANVAMAVMQAESSCNHVAVGDNWAINGLHAPSCGLFQIRTLPNRPGCEQLKDPNTNVAWAYKLYLARGWQPWSVYNNGKYLRYL
jgi:hypothetical protein